MSFSRNEAPDLKMFNLRSGSTSCWNKLKMIVGRVGVGGRVGVEVLSSPSTSRTPVRIPPVALSGLGFQSLPDRVGFPLNTSLGFSSHI